MRTREPQRDQGWLFLQAPRVCGGDMTAFLEGAKAIEGAAGRPVTSPRLLLTLWVCGIREGIGSATRRTAGWWAA